MHRARAMMSFLWGAGRRLSRHNDFITIRNLALQSVFPRHITILPKSPNLDSREFRNLAVETSFKL